MFELFRTRSIVYIIPTVCYGAHCGLGERIGSGSFSSRILWRILWRIQSVRCLAHTHTLAMSVTQCNLLCVSSRALCSSSAVRGILSSCTIAVLSNVIVCRSARSTRTVRYMGTSLAFAVLSLFRHRRPAICGHCVPNLRRMVLAISGRCALYIMMT